MTFPSLLFAQEFPRDESIHRIWGNLFGGVSISNDLKGIGYGASLTYQHDATLYSFRFSEARHIAEPKVVGYSLSSFIQHRSYIPQVSDLGLLYGRSISSYWFFYTASIGLGAIWGNYHSDTEPDRPFFGIGLPIQAHAAVLLTEELGFGILISGNINSKASYVTAALTFQMGQLRQ